MDEVHKPHLTRGPLSRKRDSEEWLVLPLHYLFAAIPLGSSG